MRLAAAHPWNLRDLLTRSPLPVPAAVLIALSDHRILTLGLTRVGRPILPCHLAWQADLRPPGWLASGARTAPPSRCSSRLPS
eukprot:7606859-Heterocapsa_arctica.AAC.1